MQVIKTELLTSTDWVHLKEKVYLDGAGNRHSWDYLERRKSRAAVVVVPVDPVLKRIVLIKQYRVVLEQYVIEFPAGLIDDGETIEQAALRELAEETGLQGRLLAVGPPLCTSPGVTNEIIYVTEAAVDLADTHIRDCHKNQHLDQTEEIEVVVLCLDEYLSQLKKWAAQGLIVDSKVWMYGLALNSSPDAARP